MQQKNWHCKLNISDGLREEIKKTAEAKVMDMAQREREIWGICLKKMQDSELWSEVDVVKGVCVWAWRIGPVFRMLGP